MRTIAFVNQKGGSGKSSLAASIAVAALEAGERPFAIDLDPQRTLFAWGERRQAEEPAVDKARVPQLAGILDALAGRGYTLVVIDSQGADTAAASEIMRRADLTLIPARPTLPDLEASKPTVTALTALARPFAFILNQCPTTASGSRSTDAARALDMLGALARPLICARTDHQDAIALGLGVTERDTAGKAAGEIRALWMWIKGRIDR
jgi:chromosome partitioning protein